METVQMDDRGRIVIPKRVRETLGLKPGDEVIIQVEGDRAVLRKAHDHSIVLEKLLGDLTFDRALRKMAEKEALRAVEK